MEPEKDLCSATSGSSARLQPLLDGAGGRRRGTEEDARLAPLDDDERMATHHRLHAVRAHLLDMAGEHGAARAAFGTAARLTTSTPEQRYLRARVDDLEGWSRPGDTGR